MDTDLLTRKFEELGVRMLISPANHGWGEIPRPLALDIARDHRGEYFALRVDERQVERLEAIDVKPRERHLLLLAQVRAFDGPVRYNNGRAWKSTVAWLPPLSKTVEKPRFLCGHDERHWFVAAIPESAHAANVRAAMEALKPEAVITAQARAALRSDRRFTRKNRAFVRQGEWFFLPQPDLVVPESLVLRNEPLQRSGGKAHWAEFAYRQGGETVYVSQSFPNGLTEAAFREYAAKADPNREQFRVMRRGARMYVRGRIAHPDHATVMLRMWHEVVMNTENHASASRNVVFLD
jgi:hypothetical protein